MIIYKYIVSWVYLRVYINLFNIEINVNTRVDNMHVYNIYMYIYIHVAEFIGYHAPQKVKTGTIFEN